jgi:hypothetical protein
MIPPALTLIKTIDQTELSVCPSRACKLLSINRFTFVAVFLGLATIVRVIRGAINNDVSVQ